MKAIVTIPAPTGGWNSTYPVTNLAPNEAIVLDNMIPDTGVVQTRLGSQLFNDLRAFTQTIGGLYEFKAANINKFIATGNGNFIDATNPLGPTVISGGFTNDYWASTIFGGSICFVNGFDIPQFYDGVTPNMQPLLFTGANLDPRNLTDIFNFKQRVWFVEKNSQNAWYSPFEQLFPNPNPQPLTKFYLGNLAEFGGNLVTIKSFSADGGSGRQEFLTFYMSSGEIIIYQGSDPSDATDFNLVGIYRSGKPINTPRCACKFGSDLIAITDSSYLTISSLLPYSFGKSNDPLTEKIRGAAIQAVDANFTAPNWQILLVQNLGLLLVNVPTTVPGVINQHVLNINTNAWCSFSNIRANVWCMFGNNLYFGDTTGQIWEYAGSTDYAILSTGTVGQEIVQTYVSPYQFDQPPGLKKSTAFRPRVLLNGDCTVTVSASADFNVYSPSYQVTFDADELQWGRSPLFPNFLLPTNNPITATNGSDLITLTVPDTTILTEGELITISGATGGFSGLTAAQINVTGPLHIVDATHITINIQFIVVGATASGGGNAVNITLYSPGPRVIPNPANPNYFGPDDPNFIPAPNPDIPWGRPPIIPTIALGADPITTFNGSNFVNVTVPAIPGTGNFVNGQIVVLQGVVPDPLNGIASTYINSAGAITVIDNTHFHFNMPVSANANGVGGGNNVSVYATPAVLPFPLGDPRNQPFFGPDDPGAIPPGLVGWATGTNGSLGYLNLNFIFYSLSIKLIFTSALQVNFYEVDYLLNNSVRI